jgi:hypothetical protein
MLIFYTIVLLKLVISHLIWPRQMNAYKWLAEKQGFQPEKEGEVMTGNVISGPVEWKALSPWRVRSPGISQILKEGAQFC